MPESFLHNLEHVGFGQDSSARCWYAAYRMMFKYLNRNQNEIKDKLAPKIKFDDAYENGLLTGDYAKVADALGFDVLDSVPFKKDQGFFDVGLSDGAEAFLVELKKKPLWVARFALKGVHHITVAVGYDDKSSSIIHHNPYPGPFDARDHLTIKANTYVKHITYQIGSVQMPK